MKEYKRNEALALQEVVFSPQFYLTYADSPPKSQHVLDSKL